MVYLVYDGSFEGFLSAVFDVYDRKLTQAKIRREGEPLALLLDEMLEVHTRPEHAQRVTIKLEALVGKPGLKLLWTCWLSGIAGVEDALLDTIRYLLKENKDVLGDYGHPAVLELRQAEKKMRRERHRMTAFVRFSLGGDGLYYAFVEPDFDVLPLLVSHFQGRYADQPWLIYDQRRKYGIYYNLHQTTFVQPVEGPVQTSGIEIPENETFYQELWKTYFTSTNIKARKNTKLHLQHVPKRYWKYLTEKLPGR